MRIIKNLIIRHSLKKELNEIEHKLYSGNYRDLMCKLNSFRCDPENYAVTHQELRDKFGTLLDRRMKVMHQIHMMSGTNIFKKFDETELAK